MFPVSMGKPPEISILSFPILAQDIFKIALHNMREWKYQISDSIDPMLTFIPYKTCYALAVQNDRRKKKSQYKYTICLSTLIIDRFKPCKLTEALYNYIMHELCHTIDGCFDHGKKWKEMVISLNQNHGTKINPKPYSTKASDLF